MENPIEKRGFEELLSLQQAEVEDKGDHFIRFMPDGTLPSIQEKKEPPPVSEEEIHQRRLEQIEREVYQKAFEEGEKTGLEVGQEKMEKEIRRLIPQLENVLRELDDLPHRVFTASEHFFVETLLSFNRELLAHELSINPEGIAERVRRIMKRSTGRKNIIIRVSPGNAEILQRMDGFKTIEFVADETVLPGSVVMESDFGGMEDNLEMRLREVETALRQQLQERLNQSGLPEIADAARQKAQAEAEAPLTPLAADPSIDALEEPLLDAEEDFEEEEDEYPLESVSEALLEGFAAEDEDEGLEEEDLDQLALLDAEEEEPLDGGETLKAQEEPVAEPADVLESRVETSQEATQAPLVDEKPSDESLDKDVES
ncbi:MAG: hypothetical protein HQL72_13185 [Magnetococcales bacterium]|nr:hypothetical protein [Magnetococcales bacterium]